MAFAEPKIDRPWNQSGQGTGERPDAETGERRETDDFKQEVVRSFHLQTKCLYDILTGEERELSRLREIRDDNKIRRRFEETLLWQIEFGSISKKEDAEKIAAFFGFSVPKGTSRAARYLAEGDRDEAERLAGEWGIPFEEVERVSRIHEEFEEREHRDRENRYRMFTDIVIDLAKARQRGEGAQGADSKIRALAKEFYLDFDILMQAAETVPGSTEYNALRTKALNMEPWTVSGEAGAV